MVVHCVVNIRNSGMISRIFLYQLSFLVLRD
jgi:hypothetical protein